MRDDGLEDELCQCINCRLIRMEKQIASMRDDFENLMSSMESNKAKL